MVAGKVIRSDELNQIRVEHLNAQQLSFRQFFVVFHVRTINKQEVPQGLVVQQLQLLQLAHDKGPHGNRGAHFRKTHKRLLENVGSRIQKLKDVEASTNELLLQKH